MKLRYEQLFSIGLQPEYYTDGKAHEDFMIEPTAACKKLMSRYKILSKKTYDGIGLYYECNPNAVGVIPLREIKVEEKFTFIVKTNNADFWYYADVQGWNGDKIFFLKNPSFITTGEINILTGALADPILFYPMKFQYRVPLENVEGLLEIRDSIGVLIKTIAVRAKQITDSANPTAFYLIDLSGYNDGQFTITHIKTGPDVNEDIYCSADYYPGTLSIIEIKYKTGVAYTGIAPFQKYTVKIKSRETDWFYDVHIREKAMPVAQANQLSIEPAGLFSRVSFSNADRFVQFKSLAKISYSQTPLQLKLKKTGSAVPLMDPLPLPSSVDVQKDATNNLFTKVIINV